jgi:ribosomal protein L24
VKPGDLVVVPFGPAAGTVGKVLTTDEHTARSGRTTVYAYVEYKHDCGNKKASTNIRRMWYPTTILNDSNSED